ncbi:Gag-pol fusion protein [Phytophthora megakarya]|uniref:Gag-pol fusion protein n=1 Tax=Phytophthora megakarya TaxID=4795 RepID=A0A225VZW8_9STRA|nr:Gag-pol fusion protein [Phytophthora megakarya]
MTSLEYLGHELGRDGVRALERLVTAVRDFPTPTDEKEVKRFVHLAGYYRRFISGFGSLMTPLTKQLRLSTTWEWTTAQETAFIQVKQILTTRPLSTGNGREKIGLWARLMQDDGNGRRPVAYASKVNSQAEANYGITELECAAVVWAIKLFFHY